MVSPPTLPAVAPWRRSDATLPGTIPTMISREERRYLRWLGAHYWQGQGHVVEIGPWLGGSTYCLCSGLRANPASTTSGYRMHVYDAFEWRAFMSERANLPLQVGDSFLPYFEENVRVFGELVAAQRRVLPDDPMDADPVARGVRHVQPTEQDVFTWTNEPIEVLFVDGAKSWDGLVYLLRQTAGSLLPGRSLVVCQDYKHWGCYWVPAICELLGSRLELTHVLRRNTAAFVVRSAIDDEQLRALPSSAEARVDDVAAALDRAAARLDAVGDAGGAASLMLGKCRFLVHRGQVDRALDVFEELERSWPATLPERALADARQWLAQQSGRPLPRSLGLRASRLKRAALRRVNGVLLKLAGPED